MTIGIAQAAVAPTQAPVSAQVVAEHILWLRKTGQTTPRGLIKLVYLCHAWALGTLGRGLVSDPVTVGRFGPIYQGLQDKYEVYGNGPIPTRTLFGLSGRDRTPALGAEFTDMIRKVNSAYGNLPDEKLSGLTHMSGTPWSVQSVHGEGAEIPDSLMQVLQFLSALF